MSARNLFLTFVGLHVITCIAVLVWIVALIASFFNSGLRDLVNESGPFVLLGGGAALFVFRRLARRFEQKAHA